MKILKLIINKYEQPFLDQHILVNVFVSQISNGLNNNSSWIKCDESITESMKI